MKKILFFLAASVTTTSVMAQIQVNSNGDLLTNTHEIYLKNTSTNKSGIGYAAFGSNELAVFTDSIIDFRQSSSNLVAAKFKLSKTSPLSSKCEFYGDISFNQFDWTGGIKSQMDSFDNYQMPSLIPGTTWYGMLGNSTHHFGAGYIDHLYVNAFTTLPSDATVKENIQNVENGLAKILELRPVSYDIKESFFDSIPDEKARQYVREHDGMNRIGFISQEVQKVMPEVVSKEPQSGLLGINTIDMIPYLVKAIQEQQKEIEDLKSQLSSNEKSYEIKSTTISDNNSTAAQASLSQNKPNPFFTNTKIDMIIPESVVNAVLYIYDLQGKQLKAIVISGRGATSETIFGNELQAGLYIYSLVIDGNLVGSKQMILTE